MHRINGEPFDRVSLSDRGFQYGDGIFSTLKLVGGRPVFWNRHYARLLRDAARLGLDVPGAEEWLADVQSLAQAHGDGVIKCMLTRGTGGRGYRPTTGGGTRVVSWSPLPAYTAQAAERGVEIRVCRLRLARQPALAGIKHLNRLENVLARMEWDDASVVEGLLLDESGFVVEGTLSNVFWRVGDVWETPSLAFSGVAGVLREWVLDRLTACGRPAAIVSAGLDRVLQADELFICNSLMGIVPVSRLGERAWCDFSATHLLQSRLQEEENAR